jgi:lysophospholipase L1-like esterase
MDKSNALRRLRRRRWARRLTAAAIGLGVTFAVVEIGLRLLSWWLVVPLTVPKQTADFLVLCAGDSHTEGIGAPASMSYPDQLEGLLNQRDPSQSYSVVNVGRAGANSSEAADLALAFLGKSPQQPDLILFIAGKNNDHNLRSARLFPNIAAEADYRQWATSLLAESRAYRLSQITLRRLQLLTQAEDAERVLNSNDFFHERGAEEQRLMSDWIMLDLRALTEVLPGRVVVGNYWHDVQWVDQACRRAQDELGIPFVELRGFGRQLPKIAAEIGKLTEPRLGGHPNERGYALIARAVRDELAERGLLPAVD